MNDTLNIRGRLLELEEPRVMGIVNATPDSFFAASRTDGADDAVARAQRMVGEGATMIDVGACSTRPGSEPATEAEEMERLRRVVPALRQALPDDVPLSIDTFRPSVARMAVEELGADIINDVSPSPEMFRMVARLGVPYILMSRDATMEQMLLTLARQVQQLRDLGQKDIIVDPGFGFGKTLDENFSVLRRLEELHVLELPVLVGMSRKRMAYETLGTTAEEALNGTTVLNTMALERGAQILRVHDVRAAVECIKIVNRKSVNSQ